jgi:hypothetical protein
LCPSHFEIILTLWDTGQVRLALEAGFTGSQIFLYGNGKQDWELNLAIQVPQTEQL